MSFTLPSLPYAESSLEPHISAKTLQIHHGKHHQAYVTKLNELISGTEWEHKTLEEIILGSKSNDKMIGIFNNAAQIWNHSFYWNCMKPKGGGEPKGAVSQALSVTFGSYANFIEQFKAAALAQFGSGWAWLVKDKEGKLFITKTSNADLPMTSAQKALLTCDVWEHAYYLDYQNRRADYVTCFFDTLVNWDFVEKNFLEA